MLLSRHFRAVVSGGCSPVTVPGLLIVVAPLVGTQTLDAQASVFAARSIVVAARRL